METLSGEEESKKEIPQWSSVGLHIKDDLERSEYKNAQQEADPSGLISHYMQLRAQRDVNFLGDDLSFEKQMSNEEADHFLKDSSFVEALKKYKENPNGFFLESDIDDILKNTQ